MHFFKLLQEKHGIVLHPQQAKAVQHVDGPCLLLSVPGGGKTTVICARLANLILNHNISSQNILTLTYSRAAALDMQKRFHKLFSPFISDEVRFSTIHGFCFSVIKAYTQNKERPMPTIIEGNANVFSKFSILKNLYQEINQETPSEDTLEDLVRHISLAKNQLLDTHQIFQLETPIPNFFLLYEQYEQMKRRSRFIDYDDMLTGVYQLFSQDPSVLNLYQTRYPFIHVDEAQDNALVQHKIVQLLSQPTYNLFMVGDEDQSIYGFRAATPQALLDFKQDYPNAKVLFMEENFRSTPNIVKPANQFIQQNKNRYQKEMYTQRTPGEAIRFVQTKEQIHIFDYILKNIQNAPNTSYAVLYRNNLSGIALADHLLRHNIPFIMKDSATSFYKHFIIQDICAFMIFSDNLRNLAAFEKIYSKLNLPLSKEVLAYIQKHHNPTKSIFEQIPHCPSFPKTFERKLHQVFGSLVQIKTKKPIDAIDFIEHKLHYTQYLKKMCKDKGYTFESFSLILDTLKSIAIPLQSHNELIQRLEMLAQKSINSKAVGFSSKTLQSVTLSTIHSSKGLEYDTVFLIDLIEGQFPSASSFCKDHTIQSAALEEEVRLFYVGITRARSLLHILTYEKLHKRKIPVSRFVHQLKSASTFLKKTPLKTHATDYEIEHTRFGKGIVLEINEAKDEIRIAFDTFGEKRLSLNTCLEMNYLQMNQPSNL